MEGGCVCIYIYVCRELNWPVCLGLTFQFMGQILQKTKVIWVQPYQLTLAMNLGDRDATPPNGCLGLHHLGCHWQVKAYRDPLLKMLHIFFAITISRRPATRNVCTFVCVTSHPGFLRMFARLLDNSSWEPTLEHPSMLPRFEHSCLPNCFLGTLALVGSG